MGEGKQSKERIERERGRVKLLDSVNELHMGDERLSQAQSNDLAIKKGIYCRLLIVLVVMEQIDDHFTDK